MGEYCTTYIHDHDEAWTPCRCPSCQGFLSAYFPHDKPFQCKKCGEMLHVVPGIIEDEDEGYRGDGKICVKPDHLKTETERQALTKWRLDKKNRSKPVKLRKTCLLAVGHAFQRVVWADKDGRFIKIGWEDRIPLDDPRITKILNKETYEEVTI